MPIDRMRRRLMLSLGAVALLPARGNAAADVTVAAAADLRHALEAIGEAFAAKHGTRLRVTYGSSGNLARQIAQGAPFELFLSADEIYADRLVADGHAEGPGFTYGIGRLALIARKDSLIKIEDGLQGIAAELDGKRVSRFAIANPEHAPYGARAKEALERAQLWQPLHVALVLGENVAQAAQYVTTGAAEAGITALPLVMVGPARDALKFSVIPANMHSPLRQRMVMTGRATPGARAHYAFIASPEAQAILAANGFEKP